jgi:hypothetical protein
VFTSTRDAGVGEGEGAAVGFAAMRKGNVEVLGAEPRTVGRLASVAEVGAEADRIGAEAGGAVGMMTGSEAGPFSKSSPVMGWGLAAVGALAG